MRRDWRKIARLPNGIRQKSPGQAFLIQNDTEGGGRRLRASSKPNGANMSRSDKTLVLRESVNPSSNKLDTIRVPVKGSKFRTVVIEIKPRRRRKAVLARLREKYAMLTD